MSFQSGMIKGIITKISNKISKIAGGLDNIEILFLKHKGELYANAENKEGKKVNCSDMIGMDPKTALVVVKILGGKGIHYDIARLKVSFPENKLILLLKLIKIGKDGNKEIKLEHETIIE